MADKFDLEGRFLPKDYPARAEVQNWLMWQMGSAPFIGGGFGHFYHYATWPAGGVRVQDLHSIHGVALRKVC